MTTGVPLTIYPVPTGRDHRIPTKKSGQAVRVSNMLTSKLLQPIGRHPRAAEALAEAQGSPKAMR